jgi:site-specific recombinase XerD
MRYRIHLESRKLAPGTVNLRLGAVRRLAYEASDCGLLSADQAAGIRRVRVVKKIGVRLGNWLLPDQAMALLDAPDPERMKGKRDLALLAILVACRLRRHEAVELNASDLQQREDHWALVDLIRNASHIRTIPMPDWVKDLIDDWLQSAGISSGRIFRRVTRAGTVWGSGLSEKVVWHVVRQYATKADIEKLAPHDLRSYTESRTMPNRSCRCCFGVEFAANVIKGFGIV